MDTVEILKSLADETRLSIVRRLAKEPDEIACNAIVNDCSSALKLSQPTISHHFTRLVRSGVITESKIGTEKFYQLNHTLLSNIGINPDKL